MRVPSHQVSKRLIGNDNFCLYIYLYCFNIIIVYDGKDDSRNIFELSAQQTTEVLGHI